MFGSEFFSGPVGFLGQGLCKLPGEEIHTPLGKF